MLILSHRGYWKSPEEKNTIAALHRSFSLGFGTEIDLRDRLGEIVISHDPPNANSPSIEELFQEYLGYGKPLPLALNIKASGLQTLLKAQLEHFKIDNYFVFDMSVPDSLGYLDAGLNIFTRQSEYEPEPLLYKFADGVWMDEFSTNWITSKQVDRHLSNDKKVCIVSRELHAREYLPLWKELRSLVRSSDSERIMLCTDYPEKAREFAYD